MSMSALALGPPCVVCGKPVELESSKTDEGGQPVHEECYIRRLLAAQNETPPPHHYE